MADLSRFGVSVEEDLLAKFDELIAKQGYETRSEALRDLMRDALIRSRIETAGPDDKVIGSLTLVYDHHASNLLEEMTGIQHQYHQNILSVMHLHVGHNDCLELIAMRGTVAEASALADRLLSLKGIKNGKVFFTLPSSSISNEPLV
jgi:CopG family nickel-responsive transcriptional regulator